MLAPEKQRRGMRVDACMIALFLAAIIAPSADSWIRSDESRGPEAAELRKAAARPEYHGFHRSLLSYPDRYDAYLNDTFGLRDFLLRWHSLEKLFVFDVSPTPMVIMGKDDWMMYARESSLEIFRGVMPFTAAELERWRRVLEGRRDYLACRGIEYVYVIGPNKETIYPEHEPKAYNRVGPTRMEQLVEYLALHSDFRFLDLRPALFAARSDDTPDEHLYYELGTHWNGRGGVVASREVRKHLHTLFPNVSELDPSTVEMRLANDRGDSEARRMYVEDCFPQRHTYPRIASGRGVQVIDVGWDDVHPHRVRTDDPRLPRAVVFHDSFGPSIEPLVSECFNRSTWLHSSDFDTDLIEEEKPDLVMQVYVERVFAQPQFEIPADVAKAPVSSVRRPPRSFELRYRLDPSKSTPELEGVGRTRVEREREADEDFLSVTTEEGSDLVALPDFDWPSHGHTLVDFDITAPFAADLTVFYLCGGNHEYNRRDSETVHLIHGRNHVSLVLLTSGLHGRMRFRPGNEVGRFRVYGLRVSAPEPR
jgi:hypothetical protein